MMKIGDLIYSEKHDLYALYLDKGSWDGWLLVHLVGENRKAQVHDYIWEIVW